MAPSISLPSPGGPFVTAASTSEADLPQLTITMLGAGQEVGRSCCVIKHRNFTIVCDVGLHPANEGLSALPFIDELDWSTVDAILVTHFHVDHAAGLPYVMEKTNFKQGKGKVYMTHPTKAIFRLTMQDAVRIGGMGNRNGDDNNSSDQLYTEADLDLAWQNIIAVDYHQDIVIAGGLRFTPYHAGHVLGAAMFSIEIAGINVLYTGDYSREEDRHLVRAEVPNIRPDVMICESTFGVHTLPPRKEKEEQFTSEYAPSVPFFLLASLKAHFSHFAALVSNIVKRGGRCLMPISAFGNVQELLLILDEYWAAHPELHNVPILYASGLAHRGMQVYRTYIHTMNASIRSRFSRDRNDNPFAFRYVRNLKDFARWEDKGPCVMLATPQMLQGYQSRELLERWAPDRKNGLVISGYSIEGTMARVSQLLCLMYLRRLGYEYAYIRRSLLPNLDSPSKHVVVDTHARSSLFGLFGLIQNLLQQPDDFISLKGQKIKRLMTVDEISFSAHVDFAQNSSFIHEVNPKHIVSHVAILSS